MELHLDLRHGADVARPASLVIDFLRYLRNDGSHLIGGRVVDHDPRTIDEHEQREHEEVEG